MLGGKFERDTLRLDLAILLLGPKSPGKDHAAVLSHSHTLPGRRTAIEPHPFIDREGAAIDNSIGFRHLDPVFSGRRMSQITWVDSWLTWTETVF